jgi:Putative peptidoglycan binding domain
MPLLLWLLPGGFIIWLLSQRHTEARLAREAMDARRPGSGMPVTGAYYPFPRPPVGAGFISEYRGPLRPRTYLQLPAAAQVVTTADYLQHLHEATVAAQILDLVKPQALGADVARLMQAPPEVVQAFHVLSAPLGVLFAQKDLNVLGATPPLREDGVPSAETRGALRALQARFGQPETGIMDSGTAAAIRYAVGCINAQDRAHLGVAIVQATGQQQSGV